MPEDEYLPLCDEEGNIKGTALRSVCHDGKSKLLHPVVHLHIFNSKGELYLQKRAIHKDIQPGMWDTSVGGHVDPGESIGVALLREASEELGLEAFKYTLIKKYIWESELERELVHSYMSITDSTLNIDQDEIDEGKFWSFAELDQLIGKGVFTPNFEYEFRMFLSSLRQQFH